MKALLLSSRESNNQNNVQGLLTGLRQRIGTCEYYQLNKIQENNLEEFFDNFIRLSQFDRIVLNTSQDLIYRQSLFLRKLPYLAVMSEGHFGAREKRLLYKNLHVMPWLRVLSSDVHVVEKLGNDGYDSHWLRPIFNPESIPFLRHKQGMPRCLVYERYVNISEAWRNRYANLDVHFFRYENEMDNLLREQDILLYWGDKEEEVPDIVLRAMAYGAVVVMRRPSDLFLKNYHWYDKENCIFADTIEEAMQEVKRVYSDNTLRFAIASAAKEYIQYFSPVRVGYSLGMLLEPTVRRAADFPSKTRIFGFEFTGLFR